MDWTPVIIVAFNVFMFCLWPVMRDIDEALDGTWQQREGAG